MSVEYSIICDRCGSVVAAASTVALARADAARLGAQQDAREDLCARCSTSEGVSAGHPNGDRHGGSGAPAAATSSPTKCLGDGLVELLDEFVRGCGRCRRRPTPDVIDSRIAEVSCGGTGLAEGEPGSAARAFSERMSR